MRKHNLVGLLGVAAATIILGAGCSSAPGYQDNAAINPVGDGYKNQPIASSPTPSPAANNPQTPASQKLSDQPYAQYAYLISSPTLSADAKLALTGFQMTKKANADGSIQFTLKALKTEYRDQVYTLQPGQQLYFIEKFLQDDDQEANEDKNIKDDLAVIVDKDGNVVGEPASFSK
ncbi:MAG: hypothetical protein WC725_04580 [Patescibacteria group bacterium]|jgi:hypothetical protein